jgi:hypothetical protein
MPRYYFGREGELPETEGEELPDDDAARRVALIVAEEMARGVPVQPRISVFNANGDMLAPAGGLVMDIEPPKTRH